MPATYAWFLAGWAKRLSWSEVAEAFRTSSDHVFTSVEMAVTWGRAHQDLSGIEAIGVDEIAWQRRHKYLTLVQASRRAMNDELLGMTRQPIPCGTFDFVVKSALHGKTLSESLFELIDGAELVYSPPNLHGTLENENAPNDVIFPVWAFMSTHRGISWLIDERVPLSRVVLRCANEELIEDLRHIFQCEVALGQPANAMTFDSAYLEAPVRRSLSEVPDFLQRRPLDVLYLPGVDRSLSGDIRKRLRQHLDAGEGLPSASALAAAVGMTDVALRRRLAREGETLVRVKNAIRYEAAMHRLSHSTLPIERVAEELGFRETNSFYRGFKQWPVMSPQAYRLQARSH